jgi:hypothetical protein
MKKLMGLSGVWLLVCLGVICCQEPEPKTPSNAYVEAGSALVGGACTALEGVTDNGIVKLLCAYQDEVAAIAQFILAKRADAGSIAMRGMYECTSVGSVCATKSEIAAGIDMITAKRYSVIAKDRK